MSRSGVIRQAIGPARKRLIGYINVTENFVDKSVDELNLEACQKLCDDIREISAKITTSVTTLSDRDTQWQNLIFGLTDEKVAAEEAIYGEVALDGERGYLLVVDNSKDILCRLDRIRIEADRRITRLSARETPTTEVGNNRPPPPTTKLPKLTLPTFGGEVLEWSDFWDIFKINVHEQKISAAEKFAYLRAQLSGSALHSIDGLGVNDANYSTAVEILRDRFERTPSQLVAALYSQLKRLPTAAKSVESLLNTYDSLEKIFRQLHTVGESVDTNRSLVFDVLSKFPPEVVADLMQRFDVGADSSLKEIRAAFRKYIRRSEEISGLLAELQPFEFGPSSRAKGDSLRPKLHLADKLSYESKGSHTTTSAFTAASTRPTNSSNPGKPTPRNPCYLCSGSHFNGDCSKYVTLEQRRARLRELNRCFKCLQPSHQQSQCTAEPRNVRCFFCRAVGQHSTPLCPHQYTSVKPPSVGPLISGGGSNSGASVGVATSQHSTLLNISEQALLLTATTTVRNATTSSSFTARIIFDTGSHRSYITAACAKELKLEKLQNESLHVSIFGTKRSLSVASEVVTLQIGQRDGTTRSITAHTVPLITDCHISSSRLPPDDLSMLQAMEFDLADRFGSDHGSIDILIGSDYFWEFVTGSRVETPSGLYLIPSTLGLLVGGRYKEDGDGWSQSPQPALLCLTETYSITPRECGLVATTTNLPEYPDVDEYWSLETIGISDDPVIKDDDRALGQFNETVYHDGERYQVRWPWKSNGVNLPPNEELALGRCVSLGKRLDKADPEVREKYQAVIDDQLAKQVIERVPADEVDFRRCPHPVHYLPHHPVVKPSSTTTKVRIVYDASSKTRRDNPSLNECLHRGPVMLPDLCAMLIRFRTHAVALVADVEKAFLQMGLQMPDRDVTRFLWYDSDGNLIHLRFRRVPFGVISSPFLLGAVIQYHLKLTDSWVARTMMPNIYVDNVICGVPDVDRAKELYVGGKDIFRAAGMNLHEWVSNSDEVMGGIPDNDTVKSRDVKLLGMHWDSRADTLCLRNNFDNEAAERCHTKREALKIVASVYDPLGLFQPSMLPAKCFIHKLWADGKTWDEDIGSDLQSEWRRIYADICPIFNHRIPRHISALTTDDTTTIAVFCDASQVAYAAAAYIRSWDNVLDTWTSTLVCAKSRLAPQTKSNIPVSMPRLELLGLTIGSRLARFVRDALSYEHVLPVYLFTDSMCVLHWARTSKPLSTFVENRVREVNSLDASEVLYVRTDHNPADINTRGRTATDLASCEMWWRGPDWLREDRNGWPVNDGAQPTLNQPTLEMLAEYKKSIPEGVSLLAGEGLHADDVGFPLTIDPSEYSSFRRLQRVTAWCLRFFEVRVWRALSDAARASRSDDVGNWFRGTDDNELTSAELTRAKLVWVAYVQRINYADVRQAMKTNKTHHMTQQLGVGMDDDGILRCYGRFEHGDMSSEAIQPKLLSKNDRVTDLIITDMHQGLFHAGVSHTLSQLRREFWIPHGRNAVRKIISRCVTCRRHKGAPFALPAMPPWPRERVYRSSPFRYTGLDYFGPVTVKVLDTTKKVWVCLFTCLAVRAIHLEWVGDCSAKEFLDCLVRFVSRRGAPQQIISDNAAQFRVTKLVVDKIWTRVFQDDSVLSYAARTGIEWKFITELAPWQGGVYERLVGVVKGSFKAAVGRRMLPLGEFLTLCAEVEAVANSRPITYVYGDLTSGPALRPVDFLTDLAVGLPVTEPTMSLDGLGDAGRQLIRYWKLKQGRLDSLWKYWHDEYLLSLRERGHTKHRSKKGETMSSPVVGQVVLVKDTEAPRGTWKLAKVTRIVPSNDGAVRSAEVLLPNKVTIRRAISHLYPLEIESMPLSVPPAALYPNGTNNNDNGDNNYEDERDFDGFTTAELDEAEQRVARMRAAREGGVQQAICDNLNAVAFNLQL